MTCFKIQTYTIIFNKWGIIMTNRLELARKEYEELFEEKPNENLSEAEIKEIIKDANEKFEKDFP